MKLEEALNLKDYLKTLSYVKTISHHTDKQVELDRAAETLICLEIKHQYK